MEGYSSSTLNCLFDDIENSIIEGSAPPQKKAKVVAKLMELVQDFDNNYQPTQKKILSNYKVRRTKEGEQRRKKKFIGDFNYKQSEAYRIISLMTRHSNDKMVEGMVKLIVEEEKLHGNNLNPPREAFRSKAGLYKFVEQNIDIFKQYFDVGTTILTDS